MTKQHMTLPMALVTIILTVTGQPVFANDSHNVSVTWFSSTSSPQVNRSTMALASGYLRRGAYYARAALKKELSESDQLIANHNLCLAYLGLDQNQHAAQFCTQAIDIAHVEFYVNTIRGSNYIVSEDSKGNKVFPPLVTIIVDNIFKHSGSDKFALSRK